MSTDTSGARGADETAGGDLENLEGDGADSKSVPYEKHRSLLSEKKKTQAELADARKKLHEFEARDKERSEQSMKEKEDYKGLLAQRDKELQEERTQRKQLTESVQNSEKLASFLGKVNGNVSEQYWGLVDLAQIHVDPNTGRVDDASAQKYAREFEKKYGLVLQKKGGGKLPDDAPNSSARLTYDEWMKLPLKQQRARLKDIVP